jgi:hypothetical protein
MKHIFLMILSLIGYNTDAQVIHWLTQPNEDLGSIPNADVFRAKISANGQYLSISAKASNLLPDDNNHLSDVFIINLQTGDTQMVSLTQTGLQAHDFGTSGFTQPTSDGKYVGFVTYSTAFPNSIGFAHDMFYIKNLVTGEVVNHSDYGTDEYFEVLEEFHMNDNATTLVFETYNKIDPLHTSFDTQVYHKTLANDTFELISISADGTAAANDRVNLLDVSDNGRYVMMATAATNLTNDVLNNNSRNLYRRDLVLDTTILINKTPTGQTTTTGSYFNSAHVSNNGTVVFTSEESELINNDTNNKRDVFYFDGVQIKRINLDPQGNQLIDSSPAYTGISGDGSRIVFSEDSLDIMNLTESTGYQIYVYDTNSEQLSLISANGGNPANDRSEFPHFSTNGDRLAFTSYASDLGNTPRVKLFSDAFVYSFSQHAIYAPVTASEPVNTYLAESVFPKMSSNQQYVAYHSRSVNVVQEPIDDADGDLFILDRSDNSVVQIGHKTWSPLDISPSGRYIVYRSEYFQPEGMIDLGVNTLFLHDRLDDSYTAIGNSYQFAVNDDGLVVFETEEELVAEDSNGVDDIYLFDSNSGQTHLVSKDQSGLAGGAAYPDIAGTGNNVWIAFSGFTDNYVNADNNNLSDVFVKQWPTGPTIRASQTAAGTEGDGVSYLAKLSTDSQYVAFVTAATNLTNDDYSNVNSDQILRFNRSTLAVELASRNELGLPIQAHSAQIYELSISDSGRYVTYAFNGDSFDPDFSNDDDNRKDVVLYDFQTETAEIISHLPNGTNINSEFSRAEVVEDLTLSPPRLGVLMQGGHELTGVENHPGFDEIYLYQDGGPPFNLTVGVIGPGSVSGTGGISCSGTCEYQRVLGVDLSLVAQPDNDAIFQGWQLDYGDCSGDINPCSLTMDRDKVLTATFVSTADIIFSNGFD